MNNKIVILLLCICLVVSTLQVSFADTNYTRTGDNVKIGGNSYKVLEENNKCQVVQLENDSIEVISTLDEEIYKSSSNKLKQIHNKYQSRKKAPISNVDEPSPIMNLYVSGRVGVPYCKQETTYWCGPAAAQQVIKEDGISVTQTTLASAAGATPSGTASESLLDAMNTYNTSYSYSGTAVATASDSAYLSDISIYGKEQDEGCVYLVKTTPLPYYAGKVITHFISGDGYTGTEFSAQTIYLVDPNYDSTYSGNRSASVSTLTDALNLTTWDYGNGTWRVNVIW